MTPFRKGKQCGVLPFVVWPKKYEDRTLFYATADVRFMSIGAQRAYF
jgi:hypothetical protein